MAQVSDRVIAWLWSVVQNYRRPPLVNSHAVAILSSYTSFKPRTAVFTYEDGHSALLVCLSGSLQVEFRGASYRYPVDIWIPEEYGDHGVGPICYVKPAEGSVIRPGQHVAHDGKVYHPYLHTWDTVLPRSSIVDFLNVLQDVFAREPPLAAKSSRAPSSPRVQQPSGRPPLPPKRVDTESPVQAGPSRPPKCNDDGQPPNGPPLPPLPHQIADNSGQRTGSPLRQSATPSRYAAPPPLPGQKPRTDIPAGIYHQPLTTQQSTQSSRSSSYDMSGLSQAADQIGRLPMPATHWRPDHRQVTTHRVGPTADQRDNRGRSSQNQSQTQPQLPSQPAEVHPPLDLLSDPFDISLTDVAAANSPAPPIPPNPEREHICALLSSSLVDLINAKVDRNVSAIAPLQAQNMAMQEAYARLKAELAQIQTLDAALGNNEPILHQSIRDCDAVISSSKETPEPSVDEFLVAPTTVTQQLWNLCADEVAIREALWCLQRAVGAGRIGGADYVKLTRGLAREAFLKMALTRKIAKALGLDLGLTAQRADPT